MRKAIVRRGLSQEEAAELLEVPRFTLSRWINGERLPDLRHAIMVQRQFGVAVDGWAELLTGVCVTRS